MAIHAHHKEEEENSGRVKDRDIDAHRSARRAPAGVLKPKLGAVGTASQEMFGVLRFRFNPRGEISPMQPAKFRIRLPITAGSLTLAAVAAITVGSGSSHTAQPAALAVQTGSFPPVNLDDCPTLHAGYPTGGRVAELQKELNLIAGNNILTVDGTFGSVHSRT